MEKYITICGEFKLHIPKAVCYEPFFVGVEDKTIIQGADFDLRKNVKAFDGLGNEIPYTVTPNTIDLCDVGTHTFLYTADGVTEQRTITIEESSAPVITIDDDVVVTPGSYVYTGIGVSAIDGNGRSIPVVCLEGDRVQYMQSGTYTLHYTTEDACGKTDTATRTVTVATGGFVGTESVTITQGTDFDLHEGVHAFNNRGEEVPYTVTPDEFDPCTVGTFTYVYKANRVPDSVRTVTVTAISDPVISGVSQTLNAEPGVAFDPLDGVSAVDGNSNPLTVTVKLKENLIPYPWADTTKTVDGITFTDNGDGTLTIDGTADDVVSFKLIDRATPLSLSAGDYTLMKTSNSDALIAVFEVGQGGVDPAIAQAGTTDMQFTLESSKQVSSSIVIMMGASFDNLTVRPELFED